MTVVISAFIDGLRRLLRTSPLLLAVVTIGLLTASPAIDDLNTLLSRNFVRQYAIPSFHPDPLAIGRILPYFATWPLYLLGWTFLLGGILRHLTGLSSRHLQAFARSCVTYFWPLVRLLVIEGVVTIALIALALQVVTATLLPPFCMPPPFILYSSVLLLCGTSVLFTYATVRTVTDGRRSVAGSILAAGRFIKRRVGVVVMLSLLNMCVLFVGTVASFWTIRPTTIADVPLLFSCLFLAKLIALLVTYASSTAYYVKELSNPKR